MKRISVHGQGTVYYLTAFVFNGKNDPLMAKAGFSEDWDYIAVIRWGPDPEFMMGSRDSPAFEIAKTSKNSGCPVLNAAINHIKEHILTMYDECHIEVADWKDEEIDFDYEDLDLTVTPGLRFV